MWREPHENDRAGVFKVISARRESPESNLGTSLEQVPAGDLDGSFGCHGELSHLGR